MNKDNFLFVSHQVVAAVWRMWMSMWGYNLKVKNSFIVFSSARNKIILEKYKVIIN